MAMGLRDQSELVVVDSEASVVVHQCWYVLLLDNVNSALAQVEVIVSLQESDGPVMRVV